MEVSDAKRLRGFSALCAELASHQSVLVIARLPSLETMLSEQSQDRGHVLPAFVLAVEVREQQPEVLERVAVEERVSTLGAGARVSRAE